MKTGLGLNFLRVVNEEGSNGWAQVYARVPFDENELVQKGALFGVVFSNDLGDWEIKEGEIMSIVDDFFNKQEAVGDLSEINSLLLDKYFGLESVWLWVTVDKDGSRKIRLFRVGNTEIWLWRNNERIDLGKQMFPNKVLKGVAKDKDKIIIWSGELKDKFDQEKDNITQEDVNKIGNSLMEDNKSAAGLIFTFEENGEAVLIDHVVDDEKEHNIPEKIIEKATEVEEYKAEEPLVTGDRSEIDEIVTDRYVGPVGTKEKVINWWKSRSDQRNPVVMVDRKTSKRKRIAVGLGLLFLVLLTVSIFSGTMKIRADKEQKQWNQFYEPIEKKRQESIGLIKVNLVGSRKLMEEVKTDFDAGKGAFLNTKFKGQVTEMENKIKESWNLASGEKESVLENSVSIELVRNGFVGDRLSLVKEESFVSLDGKMGLVVSANGKSKDIKVLAGKGEGLGWIDVLSDGRRNLLLDQTGISVVGGSRVTSFDAAVGKPIALGVFGTNVYVLDQGNMEIYRYNGASDLLGERSRWLKQGEKLAATPVDMAIDGDIWVLEDSGKVERFRRGVKENFSLNGVSITSKFSKISVEQDGEKIALLDTVFGSVSLFKKTDGSFIEQRKLEALKQSGDISFDDSGNLWVLIKGVMSILK